MIEFVIYPIGLLSDPVGRQIGHALVEIVGRTEYDAAVKARIADGIGEDAGVAFAPMNHHPACKSLHRALSIIAELEEDGT